MNAPLTVKPQDVRELARAHAPAAVGIMVNLMNNQKVPPSIRLAAAQALVDRAWGRPAQAVEIEDRSEPTLDFRERRTLARAIGLALVTGAVDEEISDEQ